MTAVAVVFGILGCLTRINAAPAFIPLVLVLAPFGKASVRVGLAGAMLAFALSANTVLNASLNVERWHVSSVLFIFDLGGMSSIEKTVLLPGSWTAEERAQLTDTCHDPKYANSYVWGSCRFVSDKIREQKLWGADELRNTWVQAIMQHPMAYVRHRLQHFFSFLQQPEGYGVGVTYPNDFGITFEQGPMFRTMLAVVGAKDRVGLPVPGSWLLGWLVYGIVLFGAILCSTVSSCRAVLGAATASAVIYLLCYVVGGVASDYRYGYWSVVALTVSSLYLLHDLSGALWARLTQGRSRMGEIVSNPSCGQT
ncbi:hypothetical protein [Microvirga pudoricolor]|uniref:hypothetical protein n=1 Tax=Microvirga pudoricolor TaxID=2778729 RepID=UPI0019523943|nr:hypothetical protein [Microvirga pudoricolor]